MPLLAKARKILEQPVCDSCLGRQFGQLLSGYTNTERGQAIRMIAAMSIDKEKLANEDKVIDLSNFSGMKFHNLEYEKIIPKERKKCSLCDGIFDKLNRLALRAVDAVRGIEFRTFVVGTRLPEPLVEAEEELWERVGIEWAEPLKAEINRELGKRIEREFRKRKIAPKFDPKNPELVMLANIATGKITATINPLFIYGEYQKLVRGIPQTKWPSGKYKTSVEQIIAKPFMRATGGSAHALHGAGREDIDARCLAWRPFILEIDNPKKRIFDRTALAKLAKKIGKQVKVRRVRISNSKEVEQLKAARYEKTYRAIVECKQCIGRNELKKLGVLVGEIRQRTPQRVLHRRPDLVRKRRVISLKARCINRHTFELVIRGEAGLYIKELISGDAGRTQPSVSGVLIKDCVCKQLDVIAIHKK
ncbi:MAG: tRNA pseudouridine(54/55) synthase Pus10 [Candidatus Aenigmatarchaeota archaeon]